MVKTDKKIVAIAAILGAITIAIGAFGAHGLKKLVDVDALMSFETGVRYQMYHSIALLIIGLSNSVSIVTKKRVFLFFLIGIISFSGSIYLLALNDLIGVDTSVIGFVTPIGGLFFILGWLYLAYQFFKNK